MLKKKKATFDHIITKEEDKTSTSRTIVKQAKWIAISIKKKEARERRKHTIYMMTYCYSQEGLCGMKNCMMRLKGYVEVMGSDPLSHGSIYTYTKIWSDLICALFLFECWSIHFCFSKVPVFLFCFYGCLSVCLSHQSCVFMFCFVLFW